MKRKLLSILMISSGLLAFGQNNRGAVSGPASVSSASQQQLNRQAHVTPHVQAPPGACDSLNFPVPATWTLSNYTTGTAGAGGYVSGPNQYGDLEKAMYYDASTLTFTKMIGCWIAFNHAYSANPAKIVPIKVYSNDGAAGAPGTLLGSQNITMGQIMADAGYYTEIIFTTPITLPASKKFYVSVDISNLSWAGSPKDSLSIISNTDGQTVPTAAWEKQSDLAWYRYDNATVGWGLDVSLLIHPFLTSTLKSPVSFTQNLTTVCQGGAVNFNGTASNPFTNCLWDFGAGNTPASSATLGQATITGTFNTVGTNLVKFYTLSGGCDQIDSAQVNITVNALPTVAATPAPAAYCVGGSSSLSATGAVSYTWTPSGSLSSANGASVTANPTTTTIYTVTGTGANSCTNTNVVTVTVNQLPNVSGTSSAGANVCAGAQTTLSGSGAASYTWTGGVTNGLAFTPAASGSYTVTGTDANNCSNTAVVSVNVNSLPTVTANSSATGAVCPGTGVTLTGGGANTYAWSGGVSDNVSFVPTTTTTYTVTGTDANNCSNTANVTVTVNTVVTPTITATGTSLSSSTGVTYQWLYNGSPISAANSQNYTATQNGNYSVITTDANGCSDTSAVEVVSIVGLKSINSNAGIKVYPNPSKGVFNVQISLEKNNAYTIELRNVLGQTVYSENINNTIEFKKSFDMSEKAGLYFVIVKDNAGKSSVNKVIVE